MPTIEERLSWSAQHCYSGYYKSDVIIVYVFLDAELFHTEEIIVNLQPKRKPKCVLQDILKEWPKCQDLTLNLEQQYQKITI
ncbi:hypothetical protein Pm5460_22A [Proteus phage vB_PmiP_Pm5460]|uniref:Uncharacterized protein n=1 Tax=Proteus phage vB_PmiP_Pm5460 TaxID=1636249 RepID=A0A0G2SSH0_9CAUD|nr:DNA repair protein [Proteus phage vB_PmiP_Pm5460]AKA61832.1 hypothetical protein Pm5460_22A [Proteus phage vB_PmiP_Pm5460]